MKKYLVWVALVLFLNPINLLSFNLNERKKLTTKGNNLISYSFKIISILLFLTYTVIADNSVAASNPIAIECPDGLYEVKALKLNIRDKPTIHSKILDTLKRGDKVCLYRSKGKWGRIDHGWINIKYLKRITNHLVLTEVSENNLSSNSTKSNDNLFIKNEEKKKSSNLYVILVIIGIFIILYFIRLFTRGTNDRKTGQETRRVVKDFHMGVLKFRLSISYVIMPLVLLSVLFPVLFPFSLPILIILSLISYLVNSVPIKVINNTVSIPAYDQIRSFMDIITLNPIIGLYRRRTYKTNEIENVANGYTNTTKGKEKEWNVVITGLHNGSSFSQRIDCSNKQVRDEVRNTLMQTITGKVNRDFAV